MTGNATLRRVQLYLLIHLTTPSSRFFVYHYVGTRNIYDKTSNAMLVKRPTGNHNVT